MPGKSHGWRSLVGCSPRGHEESDTTEQLHFHALEKEMATHSSVLAWRIPGMAEPGGLPSMGLHRVGHDLSDLAAVAAAMYICQSQSQNLSLPTLSPGNYKFVFYIRDSICLVSSFVSFYLDSTYKQYLYNICLFLSDFT